MLKTRSLLLSIALLIALMSDSQSRPSRHQASTNQAPKAEQSAAADQRGTPNEPLTVNVVPTPEQKAAAEKEATDAKEKASQDRDLVVYSRDQVIVGIVQFLVFVLQLIAFGAQAIYMRRTVTEMQNATTATNNTAVATQQSVNAMKDVSADQLKHSHQIERAYISGGGGRLIERITPVTEEDIIIAQTRGVQFFTRDTGQFQFHVNNNGKTPGKVFQIGYGFCEEGAVPNTAPTYTLEYFNSWVDPGRVSLPIKGIPIPRELKKPICFGRVYYETIFGDRYSSGFLYRLPVKGDSVSIIPPNPSYTDERKES